MVWTKFGTTNSEKTVRIMRTKPEPTALSSGKTANRFNVRVYLRVSPEGTLVPILRKYRKSAHYKVDLVFQYPTYEQELELKQLSTQFDTTNQQHMLDYSRLTEERVRRCLVQWNLHEEIPSLEVSRLHRVRGLLEDDSLEEWKRLPPLLRKHIGQMVNEALGTVG